MAEVEDIMDDQCIITSEFNVAFAGKHSYLVLPVSKLWVAVDLLARAIVPPVSTVYYNILRNPQNLVDRLKTQLLPALVAFLANSISRSLASVQKISFPVYLRVTERGGSKDDEVFETEKCVECIVLSEPTDAEIEADVIFIHGLHGGIDKTWRQGTWRSSRHKLNQQHPIRRLSSGNYYVPPKQKSLKRTLAKIYTKIPNKIARKEEESRIPTSESECEGEDNAEENENYTKCWPKDWIQKDCPNVRVIAVNYSTGALWYPVWEKKRKRTDLITRSQLMIEELLKLKVGKKPIVWVGHSKGGLFIKQIIVNAWENHHDRPELLDLFRQSKSIMWYSVPHRGSILADLSLPILKRSVELLEIQRNCDFVLNLHKKFFEITQTTELKSEIFSFIETSFTLMAFIYMKIIAYDSADPNIGVKCDVPLDHREICKPAGRDCFLYTELIKRINKCIESNRK